MGERGHRAEPGGRAVIERRELGCIGHYILADRCRFRRNTQIERNGVPRYRVSTVGDLYVNRDDRERDSIGGYISEADRMFFETMVFELRPPGADDERDGCPCWPSLDSDARYVNRWKSAGHAQEGHEVVVERFLEQVRKEEAA